ncbi:MAG: phosphoglycerate kinase [Lettuce witches'-broom phytoplasma]
MKKTLSTANVKNKKVLLRADLNVPLDNKRITDDNRVKAILPTLKHLIQNEAKVIVFSHFGRVKTEDDKKKYSLEVVAQNLSSHLDTKVYFVSQTRGKILETAIEKLLPGEVLMVENTRFEDLDNKKESKNDADLGKYWASLGDIFVNDAFGTSHRSHASNVGIAQNMEDKYFGFLVEKEINFLHKIVKTPQRPVVAVLGGSKVSDKIKIIRNLLKKVDFLLIGGGMSFTFLKAQGHNVGKSLLEENEIPLVKELLNSEEGKKIVLGPDVVCGEEFANETKVSVSDVNNISDNVMGLDIGPKTVALFQKYLVLAKTIVWNGPLGVFEFDNFAQGTKEIVQIISQMHDKATTIIGGGDSAAAVFKFGLDGHFSHISTGGGAFLEYLEGKPMFGLECIENIE